MSEMQWYYARNDQQFGPVTAQELKQLAEAGQLSPNDLLWRDGMEAWATAINVRGLFAEDGSPLDPQTAEPVDVELAVPPVAARAAQPAPKVAQTSASSAPGSLLRTTQLILWGICVLVVLFGAVLFTRAFLAAQTPLEEAAAGGVFSTFCVAAYVLARAGEKLSQLLLRPRGRRQ